MKTIIRHKWLIIVLWAVIIAGLTVAAPNMGQLVREKGQIKVPDGFSSSEASEIMENARKQEQTEGVTQVALVFHNKHKLTKEEIAEADKAITLLEKNHELGITEIISHFKDESLKSQLVSKDGKTILASVTISWNGREAKEVSDQLYKAIEDSKVDHYFTSGWMIDEDVMASSQEGLKKTEGITVIFILAVLLLVFKSLIAPVIPLLTVGLTYVASQSIVSILVDKVNFPISNFTQIFLVAVLFGIGTDYCILLLSRFKEELGKSNKNVSEAIIETYRHAGRTVFFSGAAVLIGFAAIGFSQFKLYQSAAAVAVGIAILIMALFTIVPFFMAVLGSKIFWPSKGNSEHKDSRLWAVLGRFSLARPLLALGLVAAITLPFLLQYEGERSYNSLEEISGDVPSVKAFYAIEDSFGPGEAMPAEIVIKNDEQMNSTEYISLAEKISIELGKVEMVKTVRSVSRPEGEKIDNFYVSKQAETLEQGLGEGRVGIIQISEGLTAAENELTGSSPQLKEATKGIDQLINGTIELNQGIASLQENLEKVEAGIREGSAGTKEIIKGLNEVKNGAVELQAGSKSLLEGYETAQKNLDGLHLKYQELAQTLVSLSNALSELDDDFRSLENNPSYDGLKDDPHYALIKMTVQETAENQLPKLTAGFETVNKGLYDISSGTALANEKFVKLINGQKQIIEGLNQLINGIEQQQAGLNQLANGQQKIVNTLPKFSHGLSGVTDGQKQLLLGFSTLDRQIVELTDGLQQGAAGLSQVTDGLQSAQSYLTSLSTTEEAGFYVPEEVLNNKEFEEVLDMYLSEDRKVMTFDVIFSENPYSNEAINQIESLNSAIERAVKGTKLENAQIAIGGITSMNADLNSVSNNDYTRTVILMLVGISLILIILFKSVVIPIYLIASLVLTYYTSLAINEVIFVSILGYSGISWAVPFFGFVILIALGVDYSIFLMDRFREYRELTPAEAIALSMKKMGTVIISAAIILGGTFAAMIPSGMLSLIQIASIILTGLILYALVILPLFVPVMVKTFGKANWWPFKNEKN